MAEWLALLGVGAAASAAPAAGMAAGSVAALSAAAPAAASITAGTLLSSAATAAGLVGTGVSALSQLNAGKAEQAAMNSNAQTSLNEANQRRLAAQEDTLKLSQGAASNHGRADRGLWRFGIYGSRKSTRNDDEHGQEL